MATFEVSVTIAILLVGAWLLLAIGHKPVSRNRPKWLSENGPNPRAALWSVALGNRSPQAWCVTFCATMAAISSAGLRLPSWSSRRPYRWWPARRGHREWAVAVTLPSFGADRLQGAADIRRGCCGSLPVL